MGALRFEKEEKERGKRKGKVPSSKEEERRKMATHPPGTRKCASFASERSVSFSL